LKVTTMKWKDKGTSENSPSAGFTLLEVLIAMAILAVSLLSLFSLQSTSIVGSGRAHQIEITTQLARFKMAKALVDFDQGMIKGEFPEDKEEEGTFEEQKFPDYSWKLTVKKTEVPAPPTTEGQADVMAQIFSIVSEQLTQSTREVKLIVSWKENGEEHEGITLTTHIVKMQ